MEYMTDVLDLTDAQQAQMKQIHESAKPAMKTLMQQEHQSHQALMQLITSGNFSDAAAKKILDQESQVHEQLALQHAQLAAQAYQVLTPEQKTKLTQVIARRQAQMRATHAGARNRSSSAAVVSVMGRGFLPSSFPLSLELT